MMQRVLLAVNDSPVSLAAARLAVSLCAGWGATLHAVTVVADHLVAQQLAAGVGRDAAALTQLRREHMADTVLGYVTRLAEQAGVRIETALLDGEPAPQVLDQARAFAPDLIVVGRSATPGPGQPYIGGQARHILEFAEVPVLVVV